MPQHTVTPAELERLLAERIHERAARRVRDIDVRRHEREIIVRGRADSYYAWQLAIAACRQVLEYAGDLTLDCRLDVTGSEG